MYKLLYEFVQNSQKLPLLQVIEEKWWRKGKRICLEVSEGIPALKSKSKCDLSDQMPFFLEPL